MLSHAQRLGWLPQSEMKSFLQLWMSPNPKHLRFSNPQCRRHKRLFCFIMHHLNDIVILSNNQLPHNLTSFRLWLRWLSLLGDFHNRFEFKSACNRESSEEWKLRWKKFSASAEFHSIDIKWIRRRYWDESNKFFRFAVDLLGKVSITESLTGCNKVRLKRHRHHHHHRVVTATQKPRRI